jgi:hypothetical protein
MFHYGLPHVTKSWLVISDSENSLAVESTPIGHLPEDHHVVTA